MGRVRLVWEGVKKFFERVQNYCRWPIFNCRFERSSPLLVQIGNRQLAIGNTVVLFSRVAKPATQGELIWQQKI